MVITKPIICARKVRALLAPGTRTSSSSNQAAFFVPGVQPGLTFWLIGRMVLDRCATVDEGLELIRKLRDESSE